jgi:negative regulator of flagellin synthesis FlgM
MQINSLQSVSSAQSLIRSSGPKPTGPVQSAAQVSPALDQLDLSAEAQELLSSQSVASSADAEIRMDRVAALRQAIADGSYETPERLSAALDRMLDTFS